MAANIYLVKRIAQIGEKFFQEHDDTIFRGISDINTLRDNRALSIKLFFKHMFLRGRRDSVSMKFYSDFEKQFVEYFGNNDAVNSSTFVIKLESIDTQNYDELLKAAGLNNGADRKMILSSYKFFGEIPDNNPTNYILSSHIVESYKRIDAIASIGDKLTSFYHRNLYKRFGRPENVDGNENFLLPIDTHIGKISYLCGITSEIDNNIIKSKIENKYQQAISAYSFDNKESQVKINLNKDDLLEIKNAIIQVCNENKINPMDYNQGAWCVGFYSLPMLFSLLSKSNIEEIRFTFNLN